MKDAAALDILQHGSRIGTSCVSMGIAAPLRSTRPASQMRTQRRSRLPTATPS